MLSSRHQKETRPLLSRDAIGANISTMLAALYRTVSMFALIVPKIDASLAEVASPSTEGIRSALCIGLVTLFTITGILLTDREPRKHS